MALMKLTELMKERRLLGIVWATVSDRMSIASFL